MTPSVPRPALRLIHGALEKAPAWSWFCDQCAAVPSEEVSPLARVCPSCGMGLLLETRTAAVPAPENAFLVVDSRFTVQALSRHAEALLGVIEEDVINQPVARFLGAADAENGGPEDLMTKLRAATKLSDRVQSLSVRPRDSFGVRIVARIAPCGPPRAALVVLDERVPRGELRIL